MKKNYIALGGLFACLHLLFLLFSKFVVGSELLLVLFLPLLSTIYTLKCDKKNTIMFVIATLLICFVFDIVNTFIYVIPSLMCGIVYGILRKKGFKELELLCISGLTHVVSIAFSFSVIIFLFKEVDFMSVFEKILSLNGENLFVVVFLMLIVLGFCEAFLVHVITDNELERFSSKVEKNEYVPRWFFFPAIISFVLVVVTSVLFRVYSVFAMIIFFVFFIPYIVEGIINLKYKILTYSMIVILSLFSLFIIKYIDPINYLMVPVFVVSPFVINNFKDNKEKNF